MAYEVTASRRRPQRFEDLAGQEFVAETLKNSIRTGHIAHAYLFAGPRGCGKTSTARILAKALNCQSEPNPVFTPCGRCESCRAITNSSGIDVIEIDGASNTSVNDVRQIKDEVLFPPNTSRYKIYIIDEVHMLSTSAFNALLKTIEEPPPYVIFIFATTELQKVPATIKSRCQQYNFRLVGAEKLKSLLSEAAGELGISADDAALYWIARESGGSVRDAYTLFDQVAAFSEGQITYEKIRDKLGLVGIDRLNALFEACTEGNADAAVGHIDSFLDAGVSIEQLITNAADYIRSILLIKNGITREALLGQPRDKFSSAVLASWNTVQAERALSLFLQLYRDMRYSISPRYELELAFSRLCWLKEYISPAEVKAAVDAAAHLFLPNGRPTQQSATGAAGNRTAIEAEQMPTPAAEPNRNPQPPLRRPMPPGMPQFSALSALQHPEPEALQSDARATPSGMPTAPGAYATPQSATSFAMPQTQQEQGPATPSGMPTAPSAYATPQTATPSLAMTHVQQEQPPITPSGTPNPPSAYAAPQTAAPQAAMTQMQQEQPPLVPSGTPNPPSAYTPPQTPAPQAAMPQTQQKQASAAPSGMPNPPSAYATPQTPAPQAAMTQTQQAQAPLVPSGTPNPPNAYAPPQTTAPQVAMTQTQQEQTPATPSGIPNPPSAYATPQTAAPQAAMTQTQQAQAPAALSGTPNPPNAYATSQTPALQAAMTQMQQGQAPAIPVGTPNPPNAYTTPQTPAPQAAMTQAQQRQAPADPSGTPNPPSAYATPQTATSFAMTQTQGDYPDDASSAAGDAERSASEVMAYADTSAWERDAEGDVHESNVSFTAPDGSSITMGKLYGAVIAELAVDNAGLGAALMRTRCWNLNGAVISATIETEYQKSFIEREKSRILAIIDRHCHAPMQFEITVEPEKQSEKPEELPLQVKILCNAFKGSVL